MRSPAPVSPAKVAFIWQHNITCEGSMARRLFRYSNNTFIKKFNNMHIKKSTPPIPLLSPGLPGPPFLTCICPQPSQPEAGTQVCAGPPVSPLSALHPTPTPSMEEKRVMKTCLQETCLGFLLLTCIHILTLSLLFNTAFFYFIQHYQTMIDKGLS